VPLPAEGRTRAVITALRPSVDGGAFPAKASLGEDVVVSAQVFADGHDLVLADLRHCAPAGGRWRTVAMDRVEQDTMRAAFPPAALGRHRFSVVAGIDHWASWRRDLGARAGAGQAVDLELLVGADLARAGAGRCGSGRADAADARLLVAAADRLASAVGLDDPLGPGPWPAGADRVADLVFAEALAGAVRRHRDTAEDTRSAVLAVEVEPALARFSTWYEFFPRSTSPDPGRAGTLADARAHLTYVQSLGADVVYLPPIHPIGTTNRKGPDGDPGGGPGAVGSPWAIGAAAGGHEAVDPALGTLADVEALVEEAGRLGLAVALDLAFQCSPDHPWVTEHPDWFRHRPDGSIRFAENPPKRYEDIYPLDFETEDWRALWAALRQVVIGWVDRGVRVFRVDNPHTKPFAFWQWLLGSVKADHPEVIFLSEAFTRPNVMYHLAKLGFSQSYTYFAWRTAKWELEAYLKELTEPPVVDFFRPNFWPNTPDILTETLQEGGRAAFLSRLVLAATMAANYGLYGPVFELQEHRPRHPGSEEYLGSEKYEVRHWDLDRPGTLAPTVARLNAVRREHPALQHDRGVVIHPTDNEQLIAYSKTDPTGADTVLTVVNLDPGYTQSGWVDLQAEPLGLPPERPVVVHDLLTDVRFEWRPGPNFVRLDPDTIPAHVLHLLTGEDRR
jgi:starch synthase (maltosyl-transferring)